MEDNPSALALSLTIDGDLSGRMSFDHSHFRVMDQSRWVRIIPFRWLFSRQRHPLFRFKCQTEMIQRDQLTILYRQRFNISWADMDMNMWLARVKDRAWPLAPSVNLFEYLPRSPIRPVLSRSSDADWIWKIKSLNLKWIRKRKPFDSIQ